jgi:uncharacterized protein
MRNVIIIVWCALFLGAACVPSARGFGGVEPDAIRNMAEAGNPDAQTKLGVMYATGLGMKKDKQEAARWYRKAADQGNPAGQWNLAFMYVKGEGGLATDFVEARKLFEQAAEAGFPNAQYDLGVMLLDGLGGKQDQAEAKRWFQKAADQGYREARKILKEFPGN